MGILPFSEWRPDVSSYQAQASETVLNALPRADGYGPMGSLAAFSAAFAEVDDAYTKILLHMDGTDESTTLVDSNTGGSAHTWTADGNAQLDTAQSKFGGASLLCNGVGDVITTPDHADFTLGMNDFTADCWFNCTGSAGSAQMLFAHSGGTIETISIRVWRNTSNVMVADICSGGSGQQVQGTTQFTDALNTGWHHFALVRQGASVKLFIDGVQEGVTLNIGASSLNDPAVEFCVGAETAAATNSWVGWIDEFRLSVGVARWTANFTAPTAHYSTNVICRGFFYARHTDGSVAVFAATADRLYRLDNTSLTWIDVTKDWIAYSSLPASNHWQFAQFGNLVVAVQPNVAPQVYDLTSSAAFADLGGSPPTAAYVSVVGRFLVLSGLTSNPYRIHWSGLNAVTTWTSGVSSSDYQDLPDGGIVRGVAGGEHGVIFQETAMRRLVYAPGSPVIFNIERITEDKGLMAPYSLIRAGAHIFFLAAQGFHGMSSTGFPEPIGKERFDRFFFGDWDSGNLQLVIGAADPTGSRVYWAYKSQAGAAGLFDKVLCWDYALGRASLIAASGEYLASLAAPGTTLEGLDSVSGSLDALSFSLDDVSAAALSKLSAVSSSHMVCFFSGASLEATLDTAEHSGGRRIRVQGFRPVTDAEGCYGAVGARETLQESVAYSDEQRVNGRGLCPANVSTRLARARLRIPAGTSWTFATGVEPQFAPEGRR
jgi:hypothetical protein